MDELRPIIEAAKRQHGTAQDFVLAAVREAILTGIFEPGARLRQEELAELFGTSRIPVREALRALEYEGLVTSEPHRGFTVTALNIEDVEEVYGLRVLLEGEAVRLAIPLLTNEDIAELDGLFSSMTASDDPDVQLAARERFYLRLFAVAGRPRLLSLIVRLRQEVARALRWPTIQYSPSHHEHFLDAVKDGDADRAVAQLAAHYGRVALLIRRYLREGDMRQRVVTPIDAPRLSGPHRPAGRPATRARL